jgi:hypothetical protein
MPRSRFILTVLALGALACGAVAAWWWFDADRQAFYTDDGAIRATAADAPVRDVLWRPPEPLRTVDGQPIIGRDPVVSADGDTLLLTRTSELGDADLLVAGRVGDAWTEPRALVELNTIDNELAPALSIDGRRLYFASDRPGGRGGLDIWISQREGDRWLPPTPLGFNSRDDETDPHPIVHADGREAVLFASTRPRESDPAQPPATDADIYLADLDATAPRHMAALSSPAADTGPAATPSGDFIYFMSDRDGGAGGRDLYRARMRQSDAGLVVDAARSLGPSINTAADELDPSLGLEGFAIQFAAMVDGQPRLMRAVSREVYLARSTTRGSMLGLIPWILLAAALVLALALLRRVVRDAQWQARIATLGLMAKCALVSLIVHAGIMALLAALQVPPTAGQPSGKPEGLQVALSSSVLRSSVTEQMRGATTPAVLPRAATPLSAAPSITTTPTTAAITFKPERTGAPTGAGMQPQAMMRDSAAAMPTAQFADASAASLPESPSPVPALGLPEAPAAEQTARAEASIDAPVLADAATPTQTGAISATAGASSAPVSLDATGTTVADSTRFTPITPIGEASPTRAMDDASPTTPDLPGAVVQAPSLGLPDAQPVDARAQEAGIDAPTLAEAPASIQRDTIDVRIDDAPSAVTLTAASTTPADNGRFTPDASVGEATPSSSTRIADWTPDAAHGLPAPQRPGPVLALPPTTDAHTVPAEADASALQLTRLPPDALPVPVAGQAAAPIADLDARSPALAIADPELSLDAAEALAHSSLPEPTLTLDLAPPALATPQFALPEAILHRFELLGVVIDDRTEGPLAGAQVRLDLEGADDLADATADDGTFALGFDEIPDNAALTATLEGYTPGAVNIAQRDLRAGRRVVVRLRKIDPFVIIIEPEPQVHHLGNDEFTGRINSQFQRRSEGLVLRLPFEMTREHANLPLTGAELRLLVKGTQAPNPVRLNGRQIATLAPSPGSGAFGEQVITIPSGVLRLGENVLELESIERPGSDKDDYEFVNPRVVLLVDDTKPPI